MNSNRSATWGRRAEQAVVGYLLRHGYVILDRNVRVGHLEVDIIARIGSVVALVEVRHRGPTAWQSAFESIDGPKRERLRRAAEQLWRERFEQDVTVERIRLDVASVDFTPEGLVVDHVEGGMDATC
jgi:putative endonuclease